jgi:hypothetical protein
MEQTLRNPQIASSVLKESTMSVHESRVPPPVDGVGRVGPGVLWSFIALAFLAVMLDGLDTVRLAFSLPSLSAAWNISRRSSASCW